MPLPDVERTIDLGEVGAPEFWFKYKLFDGMKQQDVIRYAKESGKLRENDALEEEARLMIGTFLIDWNIEDREGKVYPLPSEDKGQSILDMESLFSTFICNIISGVRTIRNKDGSKEEESSDPLVGVS